MAAKTQNNKILFPDCIYFLIKIRRQILHSFAFYSHHSVLPCRSCRLHTGHFWDGWTGNVFHILSLRFSFLSFLPVKMIMTFIWRSCSVCAMCSENTLYISTAVCADGRVGNLETALKGQRNVQGRAHHIKNNLDLKCKREKHQLYE